MSMSRKTFVIRRKNAEVKQNLFKTKKSQCIKKNLCKTKKNGDIMGNRCNAKKICRYEEKSFKTKKTGTTLTLDSSVDFDSSSVS